MSSNYFEFSSVLQELPIEAVTSALEENPEKISELTSLNR